MLDLGDCQCLFPNAPFPHPQVPWGRAWYSLDTKDYSGLSESRKLLCDWLLSLEKSAGVPLSGTILGGFSQGGAMALDLGLTLPVAGVCSLSGYLHFHPQGTAVSYPPVLMVHGRQDAVVPLGAARQAKDELSAAGVAVEYHELDMGHEILPAALHLTRKFISAAFE